MRARNTGVKKNRSTDRIDLQMRSALVVATVSQFNVCKCVWWRRGGCCPLIFSPSRLSERDYNLRRCICQWYFLFVHKICLLAPSSSQSGVPVFYVGDTEFSGSVSCLSQAFWASAGTLDYQFNSCAGKPFSASRLFGIAPFARGSRIRGHSEANSGYSPFFVWVRSNMVAERSLLNVRLTYCIYSWGGCILPFYAIHWFRPLSFILMLLLGVFFFRGGRLK